MYVCLTCINVGRVYIDVGLICNDARLIFVDM